MDPPNIELNPYPFSAFTLEGHFATHSTKDLHYHSCHQLLRIRTGITFLVEKNRQQPLFGNRTAFIPADLPHRSITLGESVYYKSIYLDQAIFSQQVKEILIFDMSRLGVELFDRIMLPMTHSQTGPERLNEDFLNLLLKLMETEIFHRSHLTQIPVAQNPENLKITDFIHHNYYRKLCLSDFTEVLHYSERHLSRIFKEDLKISIFEYLKLYRIFQASLLVSKKNNSNTITQIAFDCGYDSLSSFYTDFKNIFLVTPKAFRQETIGKKF